MQLILSERVETALLFLSHDERIRVEAWLDYLRNWEDDPFARSRSVTLKVRGRPENMFRTTSDLRIFYTVDQERKTITVVDMASRDTILQFGNVAAGGS